MALWRRGNCLFKNCPKKHPARCHKCIEYGILYSVVRIEYRIKNVEFNIQNSKVIPVSFVSQVFSIGIIVAQLFMLAAVLYCLFCRKQENCFIPFARNFFNFVGKNGIALAFAAALAATLSSLFYSEIAGYEPCKLCWFQRIFMYPQVILLGIALWKKDNREAIYCLVLSVAGAIVAGYHYLMQIGITPSLPCSAVGYSASCSQRFVMQFGYITIPMMSLTIFALIITFLLLVKNAESVA